MTRPNPRRRARRRVRRLRSEVHKGIDALWANDEPTANRDAVYDAMAKVLDIPRAECHVRLFSEEDCHAALANMDRIRAEAERGNERDERAFVRLSAREITVLQLAMSGVKATEDAHRNVKSERRLGRTARKLHRRGYLCEHPDDPDSYLLSSRGRHALCVVGSRAKPNTQN